MKLKKNSEYAIRILMAISDLNISYEVHTLLKFLKIPESSGMKVLNQLKNANLLSKDSLSLKKNKEDVTLLDIIECFEKIDITPCVNSPTSCKYRHGNCAACFEFFDLRDSIKQILSKKTLAELYLKQKKINR